jgi:hypothetical protein
MSEELQMANYEKTILDKLSGLTDEDFKDHLGIKEWNKRYFSYSKTLNEHNVFAYDKSGLYLLDLLEISYYSDYGHLFFKMPSCFQDSIFKSRFIIDNELTLIQAKGNNIDFHLHYIIEYHGMNFGSLFLHKNDNDKLSKIHVRNELFYTSTPMMIIVPLVEIAKKLGLFFKNYCGYEIAHDSQHSYYEDECRFQYKTDFCDHYAHENAGTTPEYTFYGKRRKYHHEVNEYDTKRGTITIGSKKNSSSYVKIYPKTPDAVEKGKNYILNLHSAHFGNSDQVCRVEVHANSQMFKGNTEFAKRNYDLFDLLNYQNLKENFFLILGNKLRFKSIKPIGYKKKDRNPIFEEINILKFTYDINYSKVELQDTPIESTENQEINKFKGLINRFLDSDVKFSTILCYINKRSRNDLELNRRYMKSGLSMALRNYKHPISKLKKKRIESLNEYINNPNRLMTTIFGTIYFDVWSSIKSNRTFI